jgi:hypothetical protein
MSDARDRQKAQATSAEQLTVDQNVLIIAPDPSAAHDIETTINALLSEYAIESLDNSRNEFKGSWFVKFQLKLSKNLERLSEDLRAVFGHKFKSRAISKKKRSTMKELELKIKRYEAVVAISGLLAAGVGLGTATIEFMDHAKQAQHQIDHTKQAEPQTEQPKLQEKTTVIFVVVPSIPSSIQPLVSNPEQNPQKTKAELYSLLPGAHEETKTPKQ